MKIKCNCSYEVLDIFVEGLYFLVLENELKFKRTDKIKWSLREIVMVVLIEDKFSENG
jgi:hypothetical protein